MAFTGARWRPRGGGRPSSSLAVPIHLDNRAIDTLQGKTVSAAASPLDEDIENFKKRFNLGAAAGAGGGDDARTMAVQTRADGRRERTWENVCDATREAELPNFGIDGPRTVAWCLSFLRRQQMHPDDYHLRWRQRHRLQVVDWSVNQHQVALRIFWLWRVAGTSSTSRTCAAWSIWPERHIWSSITTARRSGRRTRTRRRRKRRPASRSMRWSCSCQPARAILSRWSAQLWSSTWGTPSSAKPH